MSNEIDPIIDEADYIKEQYFLEVSSPGVERVLRKDKHLNESIGKEVEIKLFKQIENKKEFVGILEKFDNEKIEIMQTENNNKIEIYRKDISLIKLKYNW